MRKTYLYMILFDYKKWLQFACWQQITNFPVIFCVCFILQNNNSDSYFVFFMSFS